MVKFTSWVNFNNLLDLLLKLVFICIFNELLVFKTKL